MLKVINVTTHLQYLVIVYARMNKNTTSKA
jgi:hypothetical protein